MTLETLIFDTETSGFPLHERAPLDQQPRIVEIGGVFLSPEDGSVTDEFEILINPGIPIPAETTKIHGITDEMVASAATFADALPQIVALFERAGLVIAHNLPFDRGMMRFELARLGVTDFPWPDRELCTVGHFFPVWGRRPKLIELYEWSLRRPLAQDHRALSDVYALAEIVKEEGIWK